MTEKGQTGAPLLFKLWLAEKVGEREDEMEVLACLSFKLAGWKRRYVSYIRNKQPFLVSKT